MAIWQVDLAFTPRVSSDTSQGTIAPLFGLEDDDLKERITGILRPFSSWSEDVLTWGAESGDRIHAVVRDKRIIELTARIDVRSPNRKFIEELVGLACCCNATFSTSDGMPVRATVQAVVEAIRNSDSFRFTSDPANFFREIGNL